MMQQTLSGCAFCESPPGSEMGKAYTWGKDERVMYPICVDCAVEKRPDPDERDHHACDGCGLIVDPLAALTRFRVEVGHLEGPLQFASDVVPADLQRTGRTTSRSISSKRSPSKEESQCARVCGIQAKDVPILVLAFEHRDREPTILTNDESFAAFEPAAHSFPELSIEHVS